MAEALTKVWTGRLKQFPMAIVVADVLDRIQSYPIGKRMPTTYSQDDMTVTMEIYPAGCCEESRNHLAVGLKFIG